MTGRKAIVGDGHLGATVSEVVEPYGHNGVVLRSCRSGVPTPCVHEPRGRTDLQVGPRDRHEGPVAGRLHDKPVGSARPEVYYRLRAREPARSPPTPELLGISPIAEDPFAPCRDHTTNDTPFALGFFFGHRSPPDSRWSANASNRVLKKSR